MMNRNLTAFALATLGAIASAAGCASDDSRQLGTIDDLAFTKIHVKVVDAMLASSPPAGGTWDNFFGNPDPLVEINRDFDGGLGTTTLDSVVTTTQLDTFAPTWNEGFDLDWDAASGEYLTFNVFDDDSWTFDQGTSFWMLQAKLAPSALGGTAVLSSERFPGSTLTVELSTNFTDFMGGR